MDMEFLLYLFLISIFLTSFALIRRKSEPLNLPPGPPRLPVLGNFHLLKFPLHKTFHRLSTTYGDLMFLQLGAVPAIVVSSSEIVAEISKFHDVTFSGRPVMRVPWKTAYNGFGMVFAKYGDSWRETKKIVTSELLTMKKVQSFQAVREAEVAHMINVIAGESGPVNLAKLFYTLSNNTICRVAFGSPTINGVEAYKMMRKMQNVFMSICVSDFFPSLGFLDKMNGFEARLEQAVKEFDEFSTEILEHHRNPECLGSRDEDFVDVLLRLQKGADRSSSFSDEFIKALIQDVYGGASDTSSATLEWAMAELMRNPSVMKKAQEELRRVVKGARVEESHLQELLYLKTVIKETLRLHPAGPLLVPRETLDACKIKGYQIPANTRVFVNAHAIHLDGKSWDEPEKFKPERFLEKEMDFRGQNAEFIPFGFGRRMCPGINFATPLIELALASLLHHFSWRLPDGVNVDEMDMEEDLGLTTKLKSPLMLVATSLN